jgi:hypothetical protein
MVAIIQKLKTCKGCNKNCKIFSKGFCLPCSKKSFKSIKRTSDRGAEKRKEERSDYPEFFQTAIEQFKQHPYCAETGKRIWGVTSVNCAHLYPKRKYKSVALHFSNLICLSWEMHTLLDSYLDTRQLDKIEKEMPNTWEVIKRKVIILKDQVLETGKLKTLLEEKILN